MVSDLDVNENTSPGSETTELEIVEGELVLMDGIDERQFGFTKSPKSRVLTPVAVELEGIAANGGAVGAVVLGIWAILGSFLTDWSMLNGILGGILGLWGLSSKRPRLAWIGIILCLIGGALSMAGISEMIEVYLRTRGETM